jgi:hypothetical protein
MEPRAEHSSRKALKGVRLLVVEDDAILLMEVEEILQEATPADNFRARYQRARQRRKGCDFGRRPRRADR